MTKDDIRTLPEQGTLVRCLGGSGVVVASSRSSSPDKERAAPENRRMG